MLQPTGDAEGLVRFPRAKHSHAKSYMPTHAHTAPLHGWEASATSVTDGLRAAQLTDSNFESEDDDEDEDEDGNSVIDEELADEDENDCKVSERGC